MYLTVHYSILSVFQNITEIFKKVIKFKYSFLKFSHRKNSSPLTLGLEFLSCIYIYISSSSSNST